MYQTICIQYELTSQLTNLRANEASHRTSRAAQYVKFILTDTNNSISGNYHFHAVFDTL